MSLPTAREGFYPIEESYESISDYGTFDAKGNVTNLVAMRKYMAWLEHHHKEMLDALIKVIELLREYDRVGYMIDNIKTIIESATGLPIDEAIKRWEADK